MVQEWYHSWAWTYSSPVLAFIFTALLWLVYFLPAIVAFKRKHRSKGGIMVLNFLLGWTVLGWIGALVWSFSYPGHD
jgi:hypothetical protein